MMTVGLVLSLVLLLCYTAFMVFCFNGISKLKKIRNNRENDSLALTDVSVIVPFRNEKQHLPDLLMSLSDLIYRKGKLEFILVNDHSDDGSAELVRQMIQSDRRYALFTLPEGHAGKKSALEFGISKSEGSVIFTTDADCRHHRNWIQTMVETMHKENASLAIGPVCIDEGSRFRNKIQNSEFLSIQFISAALAGNGRAFLCNGANLAFERKHFLKVGGFRDHRHLASGDDVFLLRSFRNQNHPIAYSLNPEALVKTTPQKNLREFLLQRLRWASKTFEFSNFATLTAVVFLTIASLFPLILIISMAWAESVPRLFFIFIAYKLILDLYCVRTISRAYGLQQRLLASIIAWVFQPLYIFFCLLILPFYKPRWKGRPIVNKL